MIYFSSMIHLWERPNCTWYLQNVDHNEAWKLLQVGGYLFFYEWVRIWKILLSFSANIFIYSSKTSSILWNKCVLISVTLKIPPFYHEILSICRPICKVNSVTIYMLVLRRQLRNLLVVTIVDNIARIGRYIWPLTKPCFKTFFQLLETQSNLNLKMWRMKVNGNAN